MSFIAGALCLASSAPSRAVLVRVFPSGRVSPLRQKVVFQLCPQSLPLLPNLLP
jgi:hypothetical protein